MACGYFLMLASIFFLLIYFYTCIYQVMWWCHRFMVFFIDCSLDIFLCGFLPVFLIEVIESIAVIIILKIKRLSKQFGGKLYLFILMCSFIDLNGLKYKSEFCQFTYLTKFTLYTGVDPKVMPHNPLYYMYDQS